MLWHCTLNAFMLLPDETKRIESRPGSSGPAFIEPAAIARSPVMRNGRVHRLADANDVAASSRQLRRLDAQ